jgi:hypothetical protein
MGPKGGSKTGDRARANRSTAQQTSSARRGAQRTTRRSASR